MLGEPEVTQAVAQALIGLGYKESAVTVASGEAGAPERGIFDVVVGR